jgi:hypothetical protein
MLVATDGDNVVGFRALMRWRFEHDGVEVHTVRAVDTATHPDYQGQHVFTRLTLHAIELMRDEGVAFIFNEPNTQSLPGYLKMGWQIVGRVPIAIRPRSAGALVRLARARTSADLWSERCDAGDAAPVVVNATADAITALLSAQPRQPGLRTVRSVEYFTWRYGLEPLGYRALPAARGVDSGLAIFRVRRRGAARELVLDELLVPGADRRAERKMVGMLAARVKADYVIKVGRRQLRHGFVPLPAQGPMLTWRAVCTERMPVLSEWDLAMGDVELF